MEGDSSRNPAVEFEIEMRNGFQKDSRVKLSEARLCESAEASCVRSQEGAQVLRKVRGLERCCSRKLQSRKVLEDVELPVQASSGAAPWNIFM